MNAQKKFFKISKRKKIEKILRIEKYSKTLFYFFYIDYMCIEIERIK